LLAGEAGAGIVREIDGEPAAVFGQQTHLLAPQNFRQKHVVFLPTKIALPPRSNMLSGCSGAGAGNFRADDAYISAGVRTPNAVGRHLIIEKPHSLKTKRDAAPQIALALCGFASRRQGGNKARSPSVFIDGTGVRNTNGENRKSEGKSYETFLWSDDADVFGRSRAGRK
jgi:hypothetical protein